MKKKLKNTKKSVYKKKKRKKINIKYHFGNVSCKRKVICDFHKRKCGTCVKVHFEKEKNIKFVEKEFGDYCEWRGESHIKCKPSEDELKNRYTTKMNLCATTCYEFNKFNKKYFNKTKEEMLKSNVIIEDAIFVLKNRNESKTQTLNLI